eukprot:sb/3475357/
MSVLSLLLKRLEPLGLDMRVMGSPENTSLERDREYGLVVVCGILNNIGEVARPFLMDTVLVKDCTIHISTRFLSDLYDRAERDRLDADLRGWNIIRELSLPGVWWWTDSPTTRNIELNSTIILCVFK